MIKLGRLKTTGDQHEYLPQLLPSLLPVTRSPWGSASIRPPSSLRVSWKSSTQLTDFEWLHSTSQSRKRWCIIQSYFHFVVMLRGHEGPWPRYPSLKETHAITVNQYSKTVNTFNHFPALLKANIWNKGDHTQVYGYILWNAFACIFIRTFFFWK